MLCSDIVEQIDFIASVILKKTDRIRYIQFLNNFVRQNLVFTKLNFKLKSISKNKIKFFKKPITLKQKIIQSELNSKAKKIILKEAYRLEKIPTASVEYAKLNDYIKWVLDLPWEKPKQNIIDLKRLNEELNY
mgnify:CR=1 FL=1